MRRSTQLTCLGIGLSLAVLFCPLLLSGCATKTVPENQAPIPKPDFPPMGSGDMGAAETPAGEAAGAGEGAAATGGVAPAVPDLNTPAGRRAADEKAPSVSKEF